jgi:hypothetical protein
MNKGWTAHVNEAALGAISNMSVGAATSLMGIFRLLREEVPDGSTVVWEYALNESNHFRSGQSLESLLYHLDWFMEIARRKAIRVLPLLLWTRAEQVSGKRNRYRQALEQRLEAHGLPIIDAFQPVQDLAAQHGVEVVTYFDGNMHYSCETPFPKYLAGLVLAGIEAAVVPSALRPLQDLELALCTPEGEGRDFSNSVFRATVFTSSCPLRVNASGKLLASYVIAAMDAGAVRIEADGLHVGTYSLQRPTGGNARMLLLKHLVHWQAANEIAQVQNTLAISGDAPDDAPIVQNTFDWRGQSDSLERADAYVCALIERAV